MPARETSPPHSTNSPRVSRWEWMLVLLVVLSGLIIRAAAPGRMAVEHFDEGVYASNIWFGVKQRMRYPARHLYAPPFVPWLDEWSQIILGPTHWGTMLPGIVFGTLTILMAWWCVRRWFGTSAGLLAAIFAAFSDYHVIYSRTVLTEPVLCFLLLAAVFLIWRALVEKTWPWAIAAGLCTGWAWITKYNGWLPLAIGSAGLGAWSILPPVNESRGRRFQILGGIAFTALVIVFPVWRDLQMDGGYRVVQENHSRYIVGFSGWISSWDRQLDNHQFFDGPLSWMGLFFAILVSGFVSGEEKPAFPARTKTGFWSLVWTLGCGSAVVALAMWWGTSVVFGLLGVGWLMAYCPCWSKLSEGHTPARHLAYWLVAAWFIGLLLATPLYTPYPRLSLPWLVACWIAAAAMLGSPPVRNILTGGSRWQSKPLGKVVLGVVILAGALGTGTQIVRGAKFVAPWQDRTGLEQVAERIQKVVSQRFNGRAVVYVYAEPALFYHLRAKDISATPVAFLPMSEHSSPVPILLVAGPHAQRSGAFQEQWPLAETQYQLLGQFSYTPSDLVLLNQFSATEITDPEFQREQTIQLFLTNPP